MAGRKIFITYKYGDLNVAPLPAIASPYTPTTVRHYVDLLQSLLDADDHINKGEKDQESLAEFKDDTIATKLKGKLFDSTLTIVMLSPQMKSPFSAEDDQWMPWEIAMSMRELTRDGHISGTNAMIAVALPDARGAYDYAVVEYACPVCHCRRWQTASFFGIIAKNMFNRKQPNYAGCTAHGSNPPQTGANHSFIYPVQWADFIQNIGWHLDIAYSIRNDIDSYQLSKVP